MAVSQFIKFQDGPRLINGTKLNRLFQGNEGILSLRAGTQLAQIDVGQKMLLTVTATANTDYAMTIPTGATLRTILVYTTTAFGAVTDATIQIGSAVAGNNYVAATSIKAAGVVALTFAATAAAATAVLSMPAGSPNFFIRIAQTGGNSATGSATILIPYLLP